MTLKKTFVALLSIMILIFGVMFIGVWAVKDTDFNIEGSISYVAKGVNAQISQATIVGGGFATAGDETAKLKKIDINTDKTSSQIIEEMKSWEDISISFNDQSSQVSITFEIANTSVAINEYLTVEVSINGTLNNAAASLNETFAFLAPKGESQEFVITLSKIDDALDASIEDFDIVFDIVYNKAVKLDESGTFGDFSFTLNSTNSSATLDNCSSTAEKVVVPYVVEDVDGKVYVVKEIAGKDSATAVFATCKTTLKTIELPNTITKIGKNAFNGCGLLNNVVIPKDCETIGNAAFYECRGLNNITFSNNLNMIDQYAFSSCGFSSLILPEGLTEIKASAFSYNNRALVEVVLPSTLQTVGNNVFTSCTKLATIKIDSETIAENDTFVSYLLAGNSVETLYIKYSETLTVCDYVTVTAGFSVDANQDVEGYIKYTRTV